jgi:hypothetical protein
MFNMRAWGPALLLLALFVGVLLMPSKTAPTPYKFLDDRSQASNDQQRMLNTVVQHYGMTRERLEPIVKSMGKVETELPVALFMADAAKKPLESILALRKTQRLDWIEVMRKSGIKLDVLFEDVGGSSPEPYRSAWTEWRMKYRPELPDDHIRELVFLQLAHKITDRPVADLVKTPTLPLEALAAGKPSPNPEREAKLAAAAKKKAEEDAAVAALARKAKAKEAAKKKK